MKILYFGVLAIAGIALAYFAKIEIFKISKKAIETRTYSSGVYHFNPLTGDKAIRLARAIANFGEVFFLFGLFFCIIAFILLAL